MTKNRIRVESRGGGRGYDVRVTHRDGSRTVTSHPTWQAAVDAAQGRARRQRAALTDEFIAELDQLVPGVS